MAYLSKQDVTITLIDEDKKEFTVKFGSEVFMLGAMQRLLFNVFCILTVRVTINLWTHDNLLKLRKHIGYFTYLFSSFVHRIPTPFCKSYLPKQNIDITLVDEDMEELIVQFLHEHRRVKGWGVFSTAHKLVEGDALVFLLVNSTEFQVMNLLMIISALS
ncbi:hypothetical protein GIB67_023447 [Kingdonia uniflora]|uniref:TF-B3 domain-containing protein n=1 Tax=Kingdonia uniflora TaxID=39325 RepID=A0A7J7P9S1_9MAGN|nr:hypothetical protein GIB67_023447 [Kingdonia uniflora]